MRIRLGLCRSGPGRSQSRSACCRQETAGVGLHALGDLGWKQAALPWKCPSKFHHLLGTITFPGQCKSPARILASDVRCDGRHAPFSTHADSLGRKDSSNPRENQHLRTCNIKSVYCWSRCVNGTENPPVLTELTPKWIEVELIFTEYLVWIVRAIAGWSRAFDEMTRRGHLALGIIKSRVNVRHLSWRSDLPLAAKQRTCDRFV